MLEELASVHLQLDSKDDAATAYHDASKQYRLAGDTEKAKETLHLAADHWYGRQSNPTRAAQARGTLGEWLATQGGDSVGALDEFVIAADLYMEDQKPAYVQREPFASPF